MSRKLQKRVISIIARAQNISASEIQLDTKLEELGIDSFDGINLLFILEEEFDITLPDDIRNLKSVRDIVIGLESVLQEQAESTK